MIKSPYIQTRGRGMMPLLEPDISYINIEAVSWALGHINRYTGHAGLYSVAEHCVMGARAMRRDGLDRESQLAFLFHDAHEAYTGDVSHPVKVALETIAPGAWKKFEKLHMDCMEEFVGIKIHTEAVLKYDLAMLGPETNALMGGRVGPDWPPFQEIEADIIGLTGYQAARLFLSEVDFLAPWMLERIRDESEHPDAPSRPLSALLKATDR